MPKLPMPAWLTLPETLAWLAERGISEAAAKLSLPRAFHDGHIRTRGRGRKYTGHNTKIELNGVAWDQARVDWDGNSFAIPDSRGYAIEISEIDVRRCELSMWIGENEDQAGDASDRTQTSLPKSRAGRNPKYDWDAFFAEIAVRADLDNLPDTQAELEKDMANWCLNEWGEQPSESTIRSKISPIYNHRRRPKGL